MNVTHVLVFLFVVAIIVSVVSIVVFHFNSVPHNRFADAEQRAAEAEQNHLRALLTNTQNHNLSYIKQQQFNKALLAREEQKNAFLQSILPVLQSKKHVQFSQNEQGYLQIVASDFDAFQDRPSLPPDHPDVKTFSDKDWERITVKEVKTKRNPCLSNYMNSELDKKK